MAHRRSHPLPDEIVRVHPREDTALIANPGMGWQTFHRFADADPALEGLPSASAYFRFYWRELEHREGAIEFDLLDGLLACARAAGQKLAFRVMCAGSGQYLDVPQWLKDNGCRGAEYTYEEAKHWAPDFSDPRFLRYHFRLIEALGARYDGHPDVDHIDLGSVGLWGEWHMCATQMAGTGGAVPLPPLEIQLSILDAWARAFPRTHKLALIGSAESMALAVPKGYGWRADCLGDLGGFSKSWNHMEHLYLQQLERTGASAAWQQAPVAFESCWDMRRWRQEGWSVRSIFEYALRCHVSYLNNKSAPIPPGWRAEVEWLLQRLGYRLVIRRAEHAAAFEPGKDFTLTLEWENTGVAPPYRDYRIALRFRRGNQEPIIVVTDVSIRGWLPGPRSTRLLVSLPNVLGAGNYELAVAIVDPLTHTPAVRLAHTPVDPGGWYPLSALQVRPPR